MAEIKTQTDVGRSLRMSIREENANGDLPTIPYYVIYIDSDTNSIDPSNLESTLIKHYSDVLIALNEVEGKLSKHFNNSIVVSFGNNTPNNIINFLAKLLETNNYRVGMHFFEAKDISPIDLNKKLMDNLNDKIGLEKIRRILPDEFFCNKTEEARKKQKQKNALEGDNEREEQTTDEYGNNNIAFFHSNEIFGPEVSYAAEIAYSTEQINFILSEEVVFKILDININKKRKDIIKKIDDFNNDSQNKFLISYPIPINYKKNEVKCSFFIYSKNSETKTTIIEKFMPSFVFEKQKLKYLYIFNSTHKINGRNIVNVLDKLLKDYFINNNIKKGKFEKGQMSDLSHYFLDSIYIVSGYQSINFINNGSLSLDDVIESNQLNNDFHQTKVPILVTFTSFPGNDLDHYYRKEINRDPDNQIFIRSETIFDEMFFDSPRKNSSLIRRENNSSTEEIKSIFREKALYTYNSYNKNTKKDITQNGEYVLILFSLEQTILSVEQNLRNIFAQLFNKKGNNYDDSTKKFYLIADEQYLEILGFGILRGTWDGYIYCKINNCKNYKEVIEKMLKEKEKKLTFIETTIAKCELFFMQPLVWDEWTEALMKERIRLNSHNELFNKEQEV